MMNAPCVDAMLDADSSVERPVPSAVLTMVGEHDISTVDPLTYELGRLIDEDHANVVVDLSGVTFMDVSIVNCLHRTELRLRRDARALLLRAPSPNARRLLDLCENISPLGFHFVGVGRLVEPRAA